MCNGSCDLLITVFCGCNGSCDPLITVFSVCNRSCDPLITVFSVCNVSCDPLITIFSVEVSRGPTGWILFISSGLEIQPVGLYCMFNIWTRDLTILQITATSYLGPETYA